MATQTLAIPAAVLQFPQVPTDQISQSELAEFVGAQKTLARLQKHVDLLEASILSRLRSGATVEAGERAAEVKRGTRRSPSWKEIVKRLAGRLGMDGDAYCSNVIAQPKPHDVRVAKRSGFRAGQTEKASGEATTVGSAFGTFAIPVCRAVKLRPGLSWPGFRGV